MTDVSIRLAVIEDIADLHRIDAATDQQFIDAGHPELSGNGDYIPLAAANRGIAESRILVAERSGELVGWVFLTRSDNELCVGQIAVLPDFQKRGIGSRLMRVVLDEASEAGERSIVLSTQSDLAWNQPWYETFGFRVVPTAEWTVDMAAVASKQGAEGLDWGHTRVHMRLFLR